MAGFFLKINNYSAEEVVFDALAVTLLTVIVSTLLVAMYLTL